MDKPPRPSKTNVFLNYKIWLSSLTGNGMIEDETFGLMEKISEKGTLKAAADEAGMSYRKAWGKIKSAEETLGYALLDKHRGGKDGGNSSLTPSAYKLLEAYRALQQQFDDSVEQAFNTFKESIKKSADEK